MTLILQTRCKQSAAQVCYTNGASPGALCKLTVAKYVCVYVNADEAEAWAGSRLLILLVRFALTH